MLSHRRQLPGSCEESTGPREARGKRQVNDALLILLTGKQGIVTAHAPRLRAETKTMPGPSRKAAAQLVWQSHLFEAACR
jgi:hypothetical protein